MYGKFGEPNLWACQHHPASMRVLLKPPRPTATTILQLAAVLRNGTNARMFGNWSGLRAQDGTEQVQSHLRDVLEVTKWPKLRKFLTEVTEPVVVIASCKGMQALQILGCECRKSCKIQDLEIV